MLAPGPRGLRDAGRIRSGRVHLAGRAMKAVDVMGFAGSFAAGVDQAGFDIVSKREPAKFKGFGMDSVLHNMPWIDGQVAEPEDWDLPAEDVELVYGCPP